MIGLIPWPPLDHNIDHNIWGFPSLPLTQFVKQINKVALIAYAAQNGRQIIDAHMVKLAILTPLLLDVIGRQ